MNLNKDLNEIKTIQEGYFNQCYSIENNQFAINFNKWGKRLAIIGMILTGIGLLLTIFGLYLSGVQIYLGEPYHNTTQSLDHFFRHWLDTWIDPIVSSEPFLSQITRLCASLNPFSLI